MTTIFKNARINGVITDIEVCDGKIKSIGKCDCDGYDLKGRTVRAGLCDTHSHGAIGYDTMDGDGLIEMSAYLAENGITSWLPTTMTMGMDKIKSVVNTDLPKTGGAEIMGFHMEGPYISEKHKGAQNKEYIIAPDIDTFNTLKNIKKVTVAPELPCSMEFIKECNAVVSLGHTDADYECASEAFKSGAECLTHTFNAMQPLHHRNPGPVGAAIDNDGYVEVICDGLHIHKSVVTMLYRTFGADRMILISDSMRATGLSDGDYEFGGQTITVKNSVARTQEGAIAGSTTNLMGCVKKAIEFGIPEDDAFKMASETPAKLIGVSKGRLEVGYDADFIALDDDLSVCTTIVGGEVVKD